MEIWRAEGAVHIIGSILKLLAMCNFDMYRRPLIKAVAELPRINRAGAGRLEAKLRCALRWQRNGWKW